MSIAPLPPPPAATITDGLWAGALTGDPASGHGGRVRRWSYAAAGDAQVQVCAAVVDLGVVATAFAWCRLEGVVATWQARAPAGRDRRAARTSDGTSRFRWRGAEVRVDGGGGIAIDVPTAHGRLTARVEITADTPASLVTPTPAGGWNATQKVAGEVAHIDVELGARHADTTGGSWRDWTCGAQDRHTTWRWAAAAGTSADGRRVGLNTSTGMNGADAGEDVVWWDGVPYALDVTTLAPVTDALDGPWRVAGRGLSGGASPQWGLDLAVGGVRAASENLLVVRSRYVQPIGTFTGTLPAPDGSAVPVTLVGVTEDHQATW